MSDLPQPVAQPNLLELLLELIRRARSAENAIALNFIAVNDSHLLAPYRLAGLWTHTNGIEALSGLAEVEANAPYVQWLEKVCENLSGASTKFVSAKDLPEALSREWDQWLPPHAVWLPFGGKTELSGGILFAREMPWREIDLRLFSEWMETWFCAYRAVTRPSLAHVLTRSVRRLPSTIRKKPVIWCTALIALMVFPVRLSVLAPGELVPSNPIAIRAPLDGVIQTFFVHTNDPVKTGQPLFAYDDASLSSKLDTAVEALRTAETEQRQLNQQALTDPKARGALAAAKGGVEEKRIEVDYLRSQLERNKVLAPQNGTVFIDDPSEWIGRPVVAGQRILRLAEPEDREIEAWLPLADAIPLNFGAPARLYLSSSPLDPVVGQIRYVAYEPVRKPDGHFAYRVRATLTKPSAHRVGLKGTVRLSGGRVPLIYWVLRRPIAAAREFLGI